MQPNKRFTITLYQTGLCFASVEHTVTHTAALCRHSVVCSHMTGVLCFFFCLLQTDWIICLYYKQMGKLHIRTDRDVSCFLSSVQLIWFNLCVIMQVKRSFVLVSPTLIQCCSSKSSRFLPSVQHRCVLFFFLFFIALCLYFPCSWGTFTFIQAVGLRGHFLLLVLACLKSDGFRQPTKAAGGGARGWQEVECEDSSWNIATLYLRGWLVWSFGLKPNLRFWLTSVRVTLWKQWNTK